MYSQWKSENFLWRSWIRVTKFDGCWNY